MEQIVKNTIAKLSGNGIEFADVRLSITDYESISFENGSLRGYGSDMNSVAIGVRVLINGCWGFAGTKDLSTASIERVIALAKTNAIHGSNFLKEKVTFPPLSPTVAEYRHVPEIDPFSMPKAEKMDFLMKLATAIKPTGKIVHSYVSAEFERQEKYYANSEGS